MRVRVVGLTLALGTVVVCGVGAFVLDQVATGLAEERREAAFAQSAAAVQVVRSTFANRPDLDDRVSVEAVLDSVLPQVEGGSPDRQRELVLLRDPANDSAIVLPARISPTLEVSLGSPAFDRLVSPNLRREVRDARDVQQAQLVSLPTGVGDQEVPAVVVGSLVDLPPAGTHELYLVYRMDDEVATLSLVARAFVVGGIALVALVGTIAWLVARLVVTPVRVAARTAEQLAAGELDRRMEVTGDDEVARLAASFNVMAASLQAQITRLESLSRLQQRFVSDVSHELRTPLTTVRMAADVLHDRLGPESGVQQDVRRSAELLSAQIDRFERLLGDLLEVSRFDSGAAVLDLVEDVDLVDVVAQEVDLHRPLAEQFGVRLRLLVDTTACDGPACAVPVEVDPRRVARVVRNLLSNAIEHAEGRDVVIRVACDADVAAVGVRDHGTGIAPQDVQQVFDRFWRADPSRRRTLGGSGLGLAIALEDARLHGGRLEVWSRVGEGSHFLLTLPRRARGPLSSTPLGLEPPAEPREAGQAGQFDEPDVTAAGPPAAQGQPVGAGA
jgi:two-component system sensor histidine kinase MtrB